VDHQTKNKEHKQLVIEMETGLRQVPVIAPTSQRLQGKVALITGSPWMYLAHMHHHHVNCIIACSVLSVNPFPQLIRRNSKWYPHVEFCTGLVYPSYTCAALVRMSDCTVNSGCGDAQGAVGASDRLVQIALVQKAAKLLWQTSMMPLQAGEPSPRLQYILKICTAHTQAIRERLLQPALSTTFSTI
jgi:hypothetical protein